VKGLGGPLSLAAAAGVAVSAFLPWLNRTTPLHLPLQGLWQGYHGDSAANFATSLCMAILVVAFIFVVSAVAQSRLVALIGVLAGGLLLGSWLLQSRDARLAQRAVLNQVSAGAWVMGLALLVGLVAALVRRRVNREV